MSWEEWKNEEPEFYWGPPGRLDKLKKFGGKMLDFFRRPSAPPIEPDPELDKPPEEISEEDKEGWYIPKDWQE